MKTLIQKVVKKYPAIKLAYLFGSRARGEAGPLSDYDFAFYVDEPKKSKRSDLLLDLINELSAALKTNAVDVVILNDVEQPELAYTIIAEGQMLYQEEPFAMLVEPPILNNYFDFRESLRRNHLTRA